MISIDNAFQGQENPLFWLLMPLAVLSLRCVERWSTIRLELEVKYSGHRRRFFIFPEVAQDILTSLLH